MSNIIKYNLIILGISGFFLAFPGISDARVYTYFQPAPFADTGPSYNPGGNYNPSTPALNPVPYILSITPDSATVQAQIIKVTITGNGFIPSSNVRFNDAPRTVTYVSPTRLVVQLNERDVMTPGRQYITVINDMPGGGFSNPASFVVNSTAPTGYTSYTGGSYGASALTGYESMSGNTSGTIRGDESYKSLTANAVFGSRGFFPTGILQWIIFVILIGAIVFIWRKYFGGESQYRSAPMKHA
ncbi:MAG TPA: IPT/TIG domain-containing protein [Candidatus Paceibacterota bacterium]|nr:IPT/TIG domain-containing protein [Candidatus Paceibacterota bacterium]